MALDTRDRRASAVHVGLPWRGLLPLPDVAAEDQGDRQQVGGYYRGVLAAIPGFGSIPLLEFGPVTIMAAGGSAATGTAVMAGGNGATYLEAAGGSTAIEVAAGGDAPAVVAAVGSTAESEEG